MRNFRDSYKEVFGEEYIKEKYKFKAHKFDKKAVYKIMKFCSKCKKELPKSEFYLDKRRRDNLRPWCKSCCKDDNRKREPKYKETRDSYRELSKTKLAENKRKYYKQNKNKILESNKKYLKTKKGRLISYKKSAEARNIEFLLTEEEFFSFWKVSCHYCGSIIETIGLDRKDPSLGYEISNIVPCCSVCNKMKLDLTYDEFVSKILE